MEADPRRLAIGILERVESGGFLDALVGRALEREQLDRRSAALLTRLVYGTEAWRGRLDWTLQALVRRELRRLEPIVRAALRLGLFQVLFMDRIPAHAAVDTSVELAKAASGQGAAGLVNAVLKRVVRDGERPPPPAERGLAAHLAVRFSHPLWLVERWLDALGAEGAQALLEANNQPAPTAIRVDRRLSTRDDAIAALTARGITAEAGRFAEDAIVIEGPLAGLRDLAWAYLQGEASQLVAALVDPRPGERIADLCAAPGGKATAIAERLDGGLLVAADRVGRGLGRLSARVAERGYRNLAVVRADANAPPITPASLDAVLLDAPCSGLGTLRAHPEIRWRRKPDDIPRLAAVQSELLASSAALVRPGGRLVYATCTLAAEENELVVSSFLAAHPEWQPGDARSALPASARELVDARGALRTSPERGGLDGFYAAILRKTAQPL